MRWIDLLAASAALALMTSTIALPAHAAQPMNLAKVAAMPAIGVGYGAVAAHNSGWIAQGTVANTISGSTVAGVSIGFVAGVAALVGYEALGCRTFGIDPFDICTKYSWRDPNWRGAN